MVLKLLGFVWILFVAKLTKLVDGYDKRACWSNDLIPAYKTGWEHGELIDVQLET